MLRKNMNPKDIIAELAEVYHDDALKKTAVYYWIGQIRMGRKDLSDEPSPGRPIDVSIDDFIIKQLNIDPYSTARMIARKAGVALGTVLTHLKKSLNMKNVHLQWIPHVLNEEQKMQRVAYSKEMIKILHRASKNNFHFILSGDEAWFEYHYDPSHIWVFGIDDRDQIVNKAHKSRKTMVTIFFNIDGLKLLDVKPKGIKINADYFIEYIISPLESLEITEKAKIQKQAMYLHYDNSPVHIAVKVKNYLDTTSFTLMPHPCYYYIKSLKFTLFLNFHFLRRLTSR